MIIDTNKLLGDNRYQTIRILFIVGCILKIVLTFLPSVSYQSYSFSESPIKYMSDFEAIQILMKAQSFWGFFYVIIFASNIAFLILALSYQRRWIFISGASVTALCFIIYLFSPSNPNVHSIFLTLLFQHLATIFLLLGYFAKPPKHELDKVK